MFAYFQNSVVHTSSITSRCANTGGIVSSFDSASTVSTTLRIGFVALFAWLSEDETLCTSKRAKVDRFDEAPYGYNLKDGKLYISNDGSAEIVKRIFNEYIEGRSFDAISRSLSQDKTARKGNKSVGKYCMDLQ